MTDSTIAGSRSASRVRYGELPKIASSQARATGSAATLAMPRPSAEVVPVRGRGIPTLPFRGGLGGVGGWGQTDHLDRLG